MSEAFRFKFNKDLIEYQAATRGDKPYILHEGKAITFHEYNLATRRAANGIKNQCGKPGDGVGILMGNCPEYYYLFYGFPRQGIYSVPINVSLKKEGLRYIIENSDVKFLVVDDVLYPKILEFDEPVQAIKKIFIRRTTDHPLPDKTFDLSLILNGTEREPEHEMKPEDIAYLMYTSGTTGFPKGVINRNGIGLPDRMVMLSQILTKPDDVLYTALPLFHANALVLTATFALSAGIPFGLDKKFSASRFWDRTRFYGATQFNGLGAMIPILMKQPEKPNDADNPVRLVISAACPANLWEAFEKRFNVKIWEAYGAVDGGGVLIFNFGNAPVGSVGKIGPNIQWKLVDDGGNEVPQGEVGELITRSPEAGPRAVEYYKNPEASEKKIKGGWVHSGDFFYADKDGNLYFMDRKTDSMRRRGENISSFEVENIVEKHTDVAVCAAYGVPSELGEDEVMIAIQLKEGRTIDLRDLMRHCADNLAYFMVPRYVDIVDEIPRTETLRIIKTDLKKKGVTEKTWDREKEMPELKLKQ